MNMTTIGVLRFGVLLALATGSAVVSAAAQQRAEPEAAAGQPTVAGIKEHLKQLEDAPNLEEGAQDTAYRVVQAGLG
jgi:hypothetical protein